MTGASGYLGSYLTPKLEILAREYLAPAKSAEISEQESLDICSPESIRNFFKSFQPNCLVNLAAVNPVRGEALMMEVNGEGARNLARACKKFNTRLIHISSDVIHNGRRAPYDDNAQPEPLSIYGRSKAAGERAIEELCSNYVIIRTSLIFGTDIPDRSILNFMSKLAIDEDVRFFSDVVRQPIWVDNLVDIIIELCDAEFVGKINVAGTESISRDVFGRKMLEHFACPDRDKVESASSLNWAPNMPRDTTLTLDLAKKVLDTPILGFSEALLI